MDRKDMTAPIDLDALQSVLSVLQYEAVTIPSDSREYGPQREADVADIERAHHTVQLALAELTARLAVGSTPPAEAAQVGVTWRERWEGSGPQRGWWIIEATRLHNNDHVAYLGESPTSEAVSAIVMAHNAAIAALAQRRVPDAETSKLIEFFRKEGYMRFGLNGDNMGWSPAETAIRAMREYMSKESSLSQQPEAR